jgi:hypothetical protein
MSTLSVWAFTGRLAALIQLRGGGRSNTSGLPEKPLIHESLAFAKSAALPRINAENERSIPMTNVKVKRIDLNAHPKLRRTLARLLEAQKKRAATRAKNQAAKSR